MLTTAKNGAPEFADGSCMQTTDPSGTNSIGAISIVNGTWNFAGDLELTNTSNLSGSGTIQVIDGESSLQQGAKLVGIEFYDANTTSGFSNDGASPVETGVANGFDVFADQNNETNFTIAAEQPPVDCCGEETGAISGTVSEDTTGDGLGDTGIPGVTMNLVDSNGDIVDTVITANGTTDDLDGDGNVDPAGFYYFADVPAGDYTVEEVQPVGYIDVSEVDGGDDADNPDNTITNSIPVTVDTGETDTGNDFVEAQPMAVGSTVFEDFDRDGIQDAGEPGIPGVIVNAVTDPGTDGVFGTADDVIAGTSTTDGDGNYYIGGLAPGDYTIVIPQENFDSGGALADSPTSSVDGALDETTDLDDNGQQPGGDATPVFSQTITLTPGAEPTDDTAGGTESTDATIDPLGGVQDDGATNPELDANGNMTIDFAFEAVRMFKIMKTVIGDNAGNSFEMTAVGSESGAIDFGGTEILASGEMTSMENYLPGEALTITETSSGNNFNESNWFVEYTVTNATGDVLDSGNSNTGEVTFINNDKDATFTIDPMPTEDVTINITNVRQARIDFLKQTIPANDPTVFDFTTTSTASSPDSDISPGFSLSGDGTGDPAANTQSFQLTGQELGDYTVTENLPEGWELVSINCSTINSADATDPVTSADASTGTVSLSDIQNGDEVLCTYVNRKVDLATMIAVTSPTPAQGFYDEDDPITFTVSTENQGGAPASDITITNYLPAELENPMLTAGTLLIDGNPAPASVTIVYDAMTNEFVIDFGDDPADWLQPGQVVSFDYTADITDGTPTGTEIVNTVEISEFDTNNDGVPATDVDSTPDATNATNGGETIGGTLIDNETAESGKAGADEDDHDIAVIPGSVVLPIELSEFVAIAEGSDAVLTWITATETNNSHFEIEVSTNGLDFTALERVESLADGGNSQTDLVYVYTDKYGATRGSFVYYRIKQVDLDGTFAYTPVRLINFEDVEIEAVVFPNPVNIGTAITLLAKDIQKVEVFTLSGDLVNVIEEDGQTRSTSISTSNLQPGIYIIVINGEKSVKAVVQ